MASSAAFTTNVAASTSGEAPPSREVKPILQYSALSSKSSCFCFFSLLFWFMRKEARNGREGFVFYYVTFVFLHINKLGDVSGNASTSSSSSVIFLIMISVLLVFYW